MEAKIINLKSKNAAVPTACSFGGTIFVVGGLIVPPKEDDVCKAAILDF